ncbi:phosphotransferase enzyme family protein [Microlunatus speluncae]|uniref:phosphotransferase enzyme family protein n=1 Tax=Microlunatus speluncae TaxID=2594267 RepID=UPI0012666DDE|nr:phosphotransferase [Microlunatus speluncae]
MRLPESLRALLERNFGIRATATVPVVGQGDEAAVWRVDSEPRLIVRASPASRDPAQLAESYELAWALADRVPEVTAPLRTTTGAVVLPWQGRPVSVWPYVEGGFLDHHDQAQRDAAADLLARLHRAGLDLLRETGRSVTAGQGLVHGDFYSRNLLCRDGRIAGLIDWDDVRVERLDAELAWVTWELTKSPAGEDMITDRAVDFVAAYRRAGGPARPGSDFLQLIKERLTGELDGDDPDYVASLRAALPTLIESRHRDLVRLLDQDRQR